MSEYQQMSYDVVYQNIEDFCISNQLSKNDLKNFEGVPLIYEYLFVDNKKRLCIQSFKISKFNSLYSSLSDYLTHRYSFDSKLLNIVELYDKFFNSKRNLHNNNVIRACYNTSNAYIIDEDDNIKSIIVFQFDELSHSNPYTLVIEQNDSNILELENQVFDYYTTIFQINNIPEDLQKPLSIMTVDERNLLNMLII